MMLAIDPAAAGRRLQQDGWLVLEGVIPGDLVTSLRADVFAAWDICRAIQERNGVAHDADLTVHHLVGLRPSFLEALVAMEPLDPVITAYFGGKYILNSLGGAINRSGHASYAQRIHRDIRSYSGDLPLLLNTLVMLDDFRPDNGATWLYTRGHRLAEKPLQDDFDRHAEQALGAAGSVLIFDSNLWHSGGFNASDAPRVSITPMFCRPFVKPQFDYPRALGYDDGERFSPYLRQIIGYNSRIPATLDEWYQPPERRMYRPDQG
jgi:ectoine hydroxylase-related dioxygenase (phytanoyl-CoA dioxygenase family)